MKIGFVFDDSLDQTDGIQQYMFSLRTWLMGQGHEVHFLVGETSRTDIEHVHSLSKNFTVHFNGNKLTIPLWGRKKQIRQILEKEHFDILHVQVPYHPLMAGRIIKLAPSGTAVVGTFHVAPFSRFVTAMTYVLGVWSRPSLKKFDRMVSVSTAAQQFCAKTYRMQTDIVPNVFDYARFVKAKPLPQYEDDALTILFLGRLVPRKGCLRLLQAIYDLRQLADPLPTFRVVICGAGQLEHMLKKYVTDHGLADIVSFVGRVSEDDKPRYLASADIAAFPSSGGESFGIVLTEAMASGRTAVLGGDNPGYRTVLGARSEYIFETKDNLELTKKLQWLLSDASARQDAAAWAKETCKQYDVAVVGQKLVDIYQSVAKK